MMFSPNNWGNAILFYIFNIDEISLIQVIFLSIPINPL